MTSTNLGYERKKKLVDSFGQNLGGRAQTILLGEGKEVGGIYRKRRCDRGY